MNAIVFETAVTADHQLHCELPASLPVGSTVRVTVEPILQDDLVNRYEPRTEIGRKAMAARRAYIKGGGKLMDQDEINEEVRRRRGGVGEVRREENPSFCLLPPEEVRSDDGDELSGLIGLAEVDGTSDRGISWNTWVSKGGDLWLDITDATGGGVDSE